MEVAKLRGLRVVRVSKKFMLGKIKTNRKSHNDIYEKAMHGWHLKVIEVLEKELKAAKKDKFYQPTVYFPKPFHHLKEYDKVIELLQVSLDDEFELTDAEFSQYICDEWSWKESFTTTISGCGYI